MTDRQKILNWLKSHKYITCAQAIHNLGVYNLRSRISEMHNITARMVRRRRKDGAMVRVAQYSFIVKQS